PDPGGAREVDRAGNLRDERQRLVQRRRRVVAHGHVERLGGDILLGTIRQRPFDAGGERLDDVGTEDLDRDEAIARGLVGTKDGTESTNTYLVQHPKGAESGWRRECAWV